MSPSIIIIPVLPLYKASIFVCELYSFTLQLSHAASYYDGLNTTIIFYCAIEGTTTSLVGIQHLVYKNFFSEDHASRKSYLLQGFQAVVHLQSITQCHSSVITDLIVQKTVEKSTPELLRVVK